jgi:ABC-2 type transport system permease protein
MILNGIVSILLLPLIPLAICTLLSLLVINIPKIGRNKWLWYMLIMAAMLGISFSFMMLTNSSGNQPYVIDFVKIKMDQMSQTCRYIPGSIFGMKALVTSGFSSLLSQLMNLIVTGGYLFVLFFAGQKLYLGSILRGDAVIKRTGRKQEQTQERSFNASYIRKELAGTFKDPSVAMNALGGYIGIPMVLVMWTILKVQSKGKTDIVGDFMKMLHNPGIQEYLPIFIIGIALFLSLMSAGSSMFSACYSKDGKRLWVEKSLPVHPFDIMKGKLYMGLLVVSTLNMIAIIMASLIIKLEIWQWVYILVLSEIIITFDSLIALMIDCSRPKLIWKETVQAVKQNMNVILAMLVTLTLVMVNGFILYICWQSKLNALDIYGIAIILNAALLAASWITARKASLKLDDVQV